MQYLDSNTIQVPSVRSEGIKVQADDVFKALGKAVSTHQVDEVTAGIFMAELNRGMVQASKVLAIVEAEMLAAKQAVKEARAVALLDKAEGVLADKKMKPTVDLREAVVELDEDVRKYTNTLNELNVMLVFFGNKYQELREGLYITKKMVDLIFKGPTEMR